MFGSLMWKTLVYDDTKMKKITNRCGRHISGHFNEFILYSDNQNWSVFQIT